MEDILIIDNNSIEESVIDETEYKDYQSIDRDLSIDKSINKDELKKEEVKFDESQVSESGVFILNNNVINNNYNTKSVNISDISNYDETSLWVNSSPGVGASGFNCRLSDDLNNFDFVGIRFKFSVSSQDEAEVCYLPVNEFYYGNGRNICALSCINGNYVYCRYFYIDQNGAYISFGECHTLNASGYNSNLLIPLEVIGYKAQTLNNNENNQIVSGNNIYNYNFYCEGISDNSLSYNILNKALNEYTVSESLLGMSILFFLAFGFVLFMRKAVFRWR